MNEITESSGNLADKSGALNKSLRTTLDGIHRKGELFPKKVRLTENEILEKDLEATQAEFLKRMGEGPDPQNSPAASEQAVNLTAAAGQSGSMLEKALMKSGFDKLPMTDRARDALEDALANGAQPVTQYTGKVMLERGVPEVPPALLATSEQMEKAGVLDRPTPEGEHMAPGPGALKVGDRVVPLQWVDVGPFGAKFDLPFVPPVARVKKLHFGPAKVTKNAYPPGRVPGDMEKTETVVENRLWAIDLIPEGDTKEASDEPCPVFTKDTTMVLRLEPLAAPSGEV
jgi:hypothetical protein